MESMLSKGYVEEVSKGETKRDDGRLWYLSHHGVMHPQKNKLSVVYDCTANYKGVSLNKQLLQGPDLTNSLVGVLTRFMQDKVALMADVEGMFSQVLVPREDRHLLRLLWWQYGDMKEPLTDYCMKVHVFGAISSPLCANYALKRTADDQAENFGQEITHIIHRNFYIDDCLCSASTVSKAVKLVKGLTEVCRRGGFHLSKWVSNERKVLESIPENELAKGVKVAH